MAGWPTSPPAPCCTWAPGYGNGVANLHNAGGPSRRSSTSSATTPPITGSTTRPLNSDIPALSAPNSLWVKSADSPDAVAGLAAEAIAASYGPPGGPVSLILPADSAWLETKTEPVIAQRAVRPAPSGAAVEAAARAIRAAAKPVLLLGGQACRAEALAQAARLSLVGVRVMADTFVARQPRGAGAFAPPACSTSARWRCRTLEGTDLMVYAGTTQPVAFFAYPNRPSVLVPEGCKTSTLAARTEDAVAGLAAWPMHSEPQLRAPSSP